MRLNLEISCTLENVKTLSPDDEDFRWYIKLKCTNCGDGDHQSGKWIYVTLNENVENKRSQVNLLTKCKECKREMTIVLEPDSIKPYKWDEETDGLPENFQPICTFECRGCEIIDFEPRLGWSVTAQNSFKFSPVDLTEKDWSDYDDNAGGSIGVYDFKHRIVRA